MTIILASAVLLTLISNVEMYSRGAPNSACKSMKPNHGVPSQSGASPIRLTLSRENYRINEDIIVTLSGDREFKGYLITATTAPPTPPTPVGFLSSFASTNKRCEGMALTHANKKPKKAVTFTWKAPPADRGPVVFRYSVVVNKTTYWSNLLSDKLEYTNDTSLDKTWETEDEDDDLDNLFTDDDLSDFDDFEEFPDSVDNDNRDADESSDNVDYDNPKSDDKPLWRIPDKLEEEIDKIIGRKPNSEKSDASSTGSGQQMQGKNDDGSAAGRDTCSWILICIAILNCVIILL